jgi:hypothetical protein
MPLGELRPGTSTVVLDATLRGRLPTDSREGGKIFVAGIQQALGPWTPARTHRFAVELHFGDDIRDISWVAEAPIKPVVDCLFPVLGGRPGAPDDWKVHALQVERGRQDLRGACSVKVWAIPEALGRPHVTTSKVVTLTPARAARYPSTTRSGMTNYECLDEAAKALGSPPAGLRITEILNRAVALFPAMASVSKDGASATMDFQTINVRGRASRPGEFSAADRWNRSPAFIKVDRGVWRRLSEEERTTFKKLWINGEQLLRQESFDSSEWNALLEGRDKSL